MIRKLLIVFLMMGLLLCGPASAANEVQNLTGVFGTTQVVLDWDDVGGATHYNVYIALPSTFHTNNTSIVLDGNIDPIMEELAFQAVLFSPNPLIPDTLDTFYSLKNDTTIFFEANTSDSDVGTFDDWVGAYLDFGKDGLDTDDRYYRIQEDGTVVRQRWNGVSWIGQPGSAAQGAVAGGGTTNPSYNLFIPQTEIQFINGTLNGVTIEISHETEGVRSYSYLPTSASPDDGDTYADLYVFGNESDADILFSNVTDSNATITGLTSFDWVKFGVTSVVGGVESDITYITGVTEASTSNVSGIVYDESTGDPVRNALVQLTCGCIVFDVQFTNNTGQFEFANVFNETYVVVAQKDGYVKGSETIAVAGDDVNLELFVSIATTNSIPLLLLLFLALIDIGCIVIAFTNDDEVGTFTVFCAFVGTILSYMISKIMINGQLVESFEFASVIQNAAISYFFLYLAIIMAIMTAILSALHIYERLSKEFE